MSRIVQAARVNAILSPIGMLISILGMIVVARILKPVIYAEYASVLAIVGWALMLAEAGGNIGFMRYLKEAESLQGRGTLYLSLLLRRWIVGIAVCVIMVLGGPLWAKWAGLSPLVWNPFVFVALSVIVFASLTGLLAYYGLLGALCHADALVSSQVVSVVRTLSVTTAAFFAPSLNILAGILMVVATVEALWYHSKIWSLFRHERAPIPVELIVKSRKHGLVTVFDKITSAIGGGPFLLLILAPFYGRPELAVMAVATDLIQKALVVTGLPMSNMVLPYLNNASNDSEAFGLAAGKVIKLSILLFLPVLGALLVFIPSGLPLLFGAKYEGAVPLALLIVVPAFFDSWVRFSLVSSLNTKGKYREVVMLNIIQGAMVLISLSVTYKLGLMPIIAVQGIVRIFASIGVVWIAQREQLFSFNMLPPGILGATLIAVVSGLGFGWLFDDTFGFYVVFIEISIYLMILLLLVRSFFLIEKDIYDILYNFAGSKKHIINFIFPIKLKA